MFQLLTGSAAEAAADETDSAAGFMRRPSRISESLVAEAAIMWERLFNGRNGASSRVKEALTTTDFQAATLTVLDRETMARYQDLPASWQGYARRTTVKDFKAKKLVDLLGGKAALDLVPELTEYPERKGAKRSYSISVGKYGARAAVSFEAMVNDELDEIREFPGNLAQAARDTESRSAAALLTDGTGPNGAYWSSTAIGQSDEGAGSSSNLISGNPVLTTDNLSAAITAISVRTDTDGRPIYNAGFVLVVPPALEITALNIVNATEINLTQGNTRVTVGNWMRGRVKVVVEPWLAVLDLAGSASLGWYVVPDPNGARAALWLAFLRGREVPDLRQKVNAGQAIGGGPIDPDEGSFEIDDIQWRVRHIVGATATDMIGTAASTGAGS